MSFNEDFLHFVWKYRLFTQKSLLTCNGEAVEVIAPGMHNSHAGADFEHAKIKINGTLWAGNVEIHVKSSDWEKHYHSIDKAYDNVILHVVYENDATIFRSDKTEIPTLVLKNHLNAGIEHSYSELMKNISWIPCEKLLPDIEGIHLENWLSRVLIERLEEKSASVLSLLEEFKGSWDDTFYVLLARNFGFKTNSVPFELLAKSLPQQILAKHKNNALQIEALIFGQAGFLQRPEDEYMQTLQMEYRFLQGKYSLHPIEHHLWKFLRLRPQNFPTMRLAQFAALILKSSHLFSKIIEVKNPKNIAELFENLPVNLYWKTHYRFGKKTDKAACQPGDATIHNILLNSVVIALFSYGKYTGNQHLTDRSLELLDGLPAETNQIIGRFKDAGIEPGNAARTQALLQLKKNYCDKKNCLNCAVGAKIIKVA